MFFEMLTGVRQATPDAPTSSLDIEIANGGGELRVTVPVARSVPRPPVPAENWTAPPSAN